MLKYEISFYTNSCLWFHVTTDIKNVDELKTELNKVGLYTYNKGRFSGDKQFVSLEPVGDAFVNSEGVKCACWVLKYAIPSLEEVYKLK